MSSAINVSAILSSIAKMESELAALKAQLGGSVSKSAASAPKERKPRKKSDAPPSAWRLFADQVRQTLKDNGYTGKALGTECVQFCATLKDENAEFASWTPADILARRAAWSAPEISRGEAKLGKGWAKTGERKAAAKAASVASASDGEVSAVSADKPKRKSAWEGLSEEQRAAKIAKMQAGRAAKKAAATTETSVSAPVTNAASTLPPLPPSPESTGATKLRKVSLNKTAFLVNLENGHAWYRNADDSQGDWAGIFSKTPTPRIDFTAPEPAADDDELSFLDELD